MTLSRLSRALCASALLLAVAAPTASAAFDLEAHRGGRGLRPENTLASFGNALRLGVTTLELDTGVTKDGVVVVSHERRFSTLECTGPHVGKLIKDLTLKQVKQMDCGTRAPAGARRPIRSWARRRPSPARRCRRWPRSSSSPTATAPTACSSTSRPSSTRRCRRRPSPPATFARKVIAVIKQYKLTKRSLLQSFDWRTLVEARSLAPSLRRVALAQKATIYKGTPWTAGIAIGAKPFDDGSLALAVKDDLKAHVLSPNFPDLTDRLIKSAHNRGLTVIPWTVNEKADMRALIGRGRRRHHHRLPGPPARGHGRPRTSSCPIRSRRRSTSRRTAAAAATGRRTRCRRSPTGSRATSTRSSSTPA